MIYILGSRPQPHGKCSLKLSVLTRLGFAKTKFSNANVAKDWLSLHVIEGQFGFGVLFLRGALARIISFSRASSCGSCSQTSWRGSSGSE